MGLIWLALARAAHNNTHRYHHRSTSKNESSSNSYSSSSYAPKHKYIDCLYEETRKDESYLKEFFDMLEKKYDELYEVEKGYTEEELKGLKREINAPIESLEKANEALKETGLGLSINLNDYRLLFNGLEVPRELYGFYTDIYNIDKWNLDDLKKLRDSHEAKLSDAKLKLSKLEKKLKHTLFNRDELKEEIDYTKKSVSRLCELSESYDRKVTIFEKVVNLSEEQKELIKAVVKEIIARKELVAKYIDKYNQNSYYSCNNVKENLIEKAVESLKEEGKINDSVLQKVFLLMDLVEIKGRRGEYDFSYYDKSNKHCQIMEWFIQKVYEMDESFVMRNANIENIEETEKKLTKKE